MKELNKTRILHFTLLTICVLLIFGSMIVMSAIDTPHYGKSQDSNYIHYSQKAPYTPWGVEEYELFGLTNTEISKRFKGTLEFQDDSTLALLGQYYRTGFPCPKFLVTFTNCRVSSVQKLLVDGAGCNIKGPRFNSRNDALVSSINGLNNLGRPLTQEELDKLNAAERLRSEYDKLQKPADQ